MNRAEGDPPARVQLTRVELHALVWREPIQRLGERFGVSGVALAKRCKRLNIPVPGRGYWAKKAAGKRVRTVALPKSTSRDDNSRITLTKRPVDQPVVEPPPEVRDGPVWEQEQFESRAENRIVVPALLDGASPTVRRTTSSLRRKRDHWDRDPVIGARGAGCLDVHVSEGQIDRAARIMQSFLDGCVIRRFKRAKNDGEAASTVFVVRGKQISVRLSERQRRRERKPEKPARRGEPVRQPYPRYEFFATGELELRIGDAAGRRYFSSWRDGKRRRIEDCLNECMVGLVAAAVELQEWEDGQEALRIERDAEELRRHQAAVVRYQIERRVKQLEDDSGAWSRAERVRAFLDAAEQEAHARAPHHPMPPELTAWLTWARGVADEIDPLSAPDLAAFLAHDPNSLAWSATGRGGRGLA